MDNNDKYDEIGEKIFAVVKTYQGDGLVGLIPIIHVLHDMYFGTLMPLLERFGRSNSMISSLDNVLMCIDDSICEAIKKDAENEQ